MNKKAILIGGGASITEGIEKNLWEKIRGKDIWSLNYAYKTMPYFPTRELFVDKSFYRNNREDLLLLALNGVKMYSKK